ncbi:MAG TPA: ferritin-like domain-containing protein, partial [Polyangiaceae bacterium]|nr:ferritin-like domain-containing protein [Polyangiaceae bacterium]
MTESADRQGTKAIESLKWRLIAALSGAAVSLTACAGRSEGRHGEATSGAANGGIGGGSSGGAGQGGGSGTAGTGATLHACVPTGEPRDGIESCDNGSVHRASARACTQAPRAEGGAGGEGGAPPSSSGKCQTDADCSAAAHGYCISILASPGPVSHQCIYGCETDADCSSGSICACGSPTGTCVAATCSTDADCSDGSLCSASLEYTCGRRSFETTFHCQHSDDACTGFGDCPERAGMQVSCMTAEQHNACSYYSCGRPFLVEEALRQAPLVVRDDWTSPVASQAREPAPCPLGLRTEARAAIARHFAEAGLMEHASVAAFARFSLQLLALGAPARLVEAAAKALSDETRHAELCFGLARRYGGHAVGPGPLDVNGALGVVELGEVVELVVREGCIGETGAALEARLAAEAATDTLVRETLLGIAADEERHAVLAFEFVRWALERAPALA